MTNDGTEHTRAQAVVPVLLVAALAVCFFGLPAEAQYGGGSGMPGDPHLIATAEQMNAIGANPGDLNKHFKLIEDIDLSAYAGRQFNVIGRSPAKFGGVFDGNGHSISNFSCISEYRERGFGLFGEIADTGQIRNLRVLNAEVHHGDSYGDGAGILASYCRGIITNCHSSGTVSGACDIGGLVARNRGKIVDCSSSCIVTSNGSSGTTAGGLVGVTIEGSTISRCFATGNVSAPSSYAGGLVGRSLNQTITDCYATGDVHGHLAGGLLGGCGIVVNSYSTGKVTGGNDIGGLVGWGSVRGWVTVTNSYWDVLTSEISHSDGGTGKTTAEMKQQSTYVGWDFVGETANGTDDIWTMPEGDYPKLTWQLGGGKPARSPDLNEDGKVDFADFSQFAQYFCQAESSVDMAPAPAADGTVYFGDLVALCDNWLNEIAPVGVIAWWKLDETEGGIVHDSASNCDGTLNGEPVWQPTGGKLDGALLLDGTNDYVNAGFVLDPWSGAFSAFAWVKGGGPGQVIVSQADGTGFGGIWLGTDPANGKLTTNLMFLEMASESVITDDHWHHIGLVWNGSRRYLYVDGAEVAADTSDQFAIPCDGDLYLGAGKDLSAASFFSGLIDDVRIYDRALSFELPAKAQYAGGSGTAADPYLIATAEQINAIGANLGDWDKHFRLVDNIDPGGYAGTNFAVVCPILLPNDTASSANRTSVCGLGRN